jgi:hypothetical protein
MIKKCMDFKKLQLQIFFSKKIIKNFPLITQFFDVPFGAFRREIAGNGHSRLLKFKISRGSMLPDPLEWVGLRAGLVKFR